MTVNSSTLRISTHGDDDVHNLTDQVERILHNSGINNGLVTVFVPGSTAGVTTIEFESGAVTDLKKAVNRLIPSTIHYDHDARWGDGNGYAHVRAAFLGPSLSIPIANGTMQLGTWQQVILVDFDNRPRERTVIVHVIGE
jgi:secondary thiamine-phosphate synthase enzyme